MTRGTGMIGSLTNPENVEQVDKLYSETPGFRELVHRVTERAIDVEIGNKGEPTSLSGVADCVRYFEGVDRFVSIADAWAGLPPQQLAPLPSLHSQAPQHLVPLPSLHTPAPMGIVRDPRRVTLGWMLEGCHPGPGETAETLRRCLKERGIAVERLKEAVNRAPQWKKLVEEVTTGT